MNNGLYHFSIFFLGLLLAAPTWVEGFPFNYTVNEQPPPVIVHDLVRAIKPITDRNIVSGQGSRTIPNWSHLKKDGKIRYVETLIFLDSDVISAFNNEKKRIRRAIASLFHSLNLYMHQIDTRIIVVDVMEMVGHNITLEQLSGYRNEHIDTLPEHDVALLIRYGYEGGIAYVNGICSHSNVLITGFYPESPLEHAAVFFHELAHLLGLTHDTHVECSCGRNNDDPCLRIDGFEECSAQALVETLPSHQCIQNQPKRLPRTALAICGNYYVEPGEECDCGPESYCKSLVCNPVTCTRTISDLQMFNGVGILVVCVLIVLACCKWTQEEDKVSAVKLEREPSTVSTKTWNTPTYTPIKNSGFDPKNPIWTTPTPTQEQPPTFTSFTTPEKTRAVDDSQLPPLPPRAADYVNIARATKSTENLSSSHSDNSWIKDMVSQNSQTVGKAQRNIARDANKAIVRKPPPIPHLLDIGGIELPKEEQDGTKSIQEAFGGSSDAVSNGGFQKQRKLLINNPLNCVVPLPRTEEQERYHLDFINALTVEILNTPLTEIQNSKKEDDLTFNKYSNKLAGLSSELVLQK